MSEFIRFAHHVLERCEALPPRDWATYAACLTLVCYVVLLLSGRFRG